MTFDWNTVFRSDFILYLAGGALITLLVTLAGQIISLPLGLGLAILKLSDIPPLAWAATAYVTIFRGTPLLVQLIIIYSGLPQFGIRFSIVQAAVIALGFNGAAYAAEIFRASITAVDVSQLEAARMDGATNLQAYLKIILPQSLRSSVPPLGNELIAMLKNSSLASVIALSELLHRTTLLISSTYRALELFMMAALFYLLMTSVFTFFQWKLEKRLGTNLGA